MTDNSDEIMSLDDALRIILKVPQQESCDGEAADDGDDIVDAGEEPEQ